MENKIITIDGPAGSGKSTIAKLLAKKLGLVYIDTGAMYRALTLLAIENNIDLNDEKSILDIAKKSELKFENNVNDENKYTKVILNGRDISLDIRSKKVGDAVSIVSKLSGIREYLVKLQREMASSSPSVLEGRDTGSIVCPDAICKIYLTANIEERVKRREKQLCKNNQSLSKSQIKCEIETRDEIDSSRENSPLIVPEGSTVIDTTFMTIENEFDLIKNIYIKKLKGK
ncbi:MAG: (d)CMP kinase [Actinomycetota bacterium]|nr:(d)CMP kinase [Actinomycetota bacterium]